MSLFQAVSEARWPWARLWVFDKPQAKMLQNVLDYFLILDEVYDLHGTLAFGAGKQVDFIALLNSSNLFTIQDVIPELENLSTSDNQVIEPVSGV